MKLLRSALIMILSLFVLAACAAAGNSLEGEWSLLSLNGEPVVEGTTISLDLKDGQAGGSAGCNSYGGDYEVSEDTIDFGDMNMTLMACTDAGVMEQEGSYLGALAAVETFALNDSELVLSGPDVELVFLRK